MIKGLLVRQCLASDLRMACGLEVLMHVVTRHQGASLHYLWYNLFSDWVLNVQGVVNTSLILGNNTEYDTNLIWIREIISQCITVKLLNGIILFYISPFMLCENHLYMAICFYLTSSMCFLIKTENGAVLSLQEQQKHSRFGLISAYWSRHCSTTKKLFTEHIIATQVKGHHPKYPGLFEHYL